MTGRRGAPFRVSVQRRLWVLVLLTFVIDSAVFALVAATEWRLGSSLWPGGAGPVSSLVAAAVPAAFLVLDLGVGIVLTAYTVGVLAVPLEWLLRSAVQIAGGERPPVPDVERPDEIGRLARAIQGWQDATAARDLLLERAPIGIVQIDRSGRIRDVNHAAQRMLGRTAGELNGRDAIELVHPDDLPGALATRSALLAGDLDRATFEGRLATAAGPPLWCSATVAPIAVAGGPVETFLVIFEDVTDRHRQVEAAARLQRELLPRPPPPIAGYQLAGDRRSAGEVAGDLYDWVLTGDGRHLDLTVACVAGTGMAAALVAATLQTALRAAPQELGPSARVAGGDRSIVFDVEELGLSVRLFHSRLELATGILTYVDAGHGNAAILRPAGEPTPLEPTARPIGASGGEAFGERTVALAPGDVLVVHSDGVGRGGEVDGSSDASCIVQGLLAAVTEPAAGDATAVALRRLQRFSC